MKVHQHKRQRTQWVILLTSLTMVVEVVAGYWSGSMALLADGWHMGSHVGALTIAWLGYRLADDANFRARYPQGGERILLLGGYTSAVVLVLTAIWMLAESIDRIFHPATIHAQQAMVVAVIGLVVNLASAAILGHPHEETGPQGHHHHGCSHGHEHDHAHGHEQDLNMAGAYAHVIADALTSVLALIALGLSWWQGWDWADPLVGILGALMILNWGQKLLRQSAHQLLGGKS